MTLEEIKQQIATTIEEYEALEAEAAANGNYDNDADGELWDSWPRIFYKDLPTSLKKKADEITIDRVKDFLYKNYSIDTLASIAAGNFDKKIAQALHSARYTLLPDGENIEVVLVASDFLEVWERVTRLASSTGPKKTFNINGRRKTNAIINKLLSEPYLPMLNGAPVNDIMQITAKRPPKEEYIIDVTMATKDGHKITIKNFDDLQGVLGTPAKKILDTALLYLTSQNYYRSKSDRISPTVEIPLIEYGEACGYRLTPQTMATAEEQAAENNRVNERLKELKKNVRNSLHDLANICWSGTEAKGRNRGDYNEMHIISSHSIRNGLIRINFDIDAAAYLVNAYIMQYPTVLLKHSNRKPTAYALGRKIAFHHSNLQNAAAGRENTLSVVSLLAAAPEIPTIDEIRARGQNNWRDKIKKPLEKALDENIKVGYISEWEYRDPTSAAAFTSESAQTLTWAQYTHLVIDFVVINAPDQSEALKKIEERKQAREELEKLEKLEKPARKK